MSRTRRLSLRARMLVMLVGVTTILLLIMGTVSTILFVHRVDRQGGEFEASLKAASTFTPDMLWNNPEGYAAVKVPLHRYLAAESLTKDSLPELTRLLVAAVDRKLANQRFAAVKRLAASGNLQAAAAAIQSRNSQSSLYFGSKPFDITPGLRAAGRWIPADQPGGPAMLFVAKPVPDEPGQVRGFIIAELITGAALIALLAVAGEWLIGQGLEPLDQMTSTANEITSRGDLTARMPDADDQTEVGRLGASINTMLDRIQQAFSSRLHSEHKVREFAADASHELRTPLTTIRGYAELYRQGALGPEQLPSAMRRIEQEAQRMSTLVAELLELARLDRTSSLDLTETDLASIVRDAVADAVAVEPQRPVRAEAPPRLVAVVDEPRVRQVLANLLGNVRAHTPVTTPVAVRLGAITGGVLIEVADAGPGMSKEDAIRAFDRFHRATDRPVRADSPDADRPMKPVARRRAAEQGRRAGGDRGGRRAAAGGYSGSDQGGAVLDFDSASQAGNTSGRPGPNGAARVNGAAHLNGAGQNGAGGSEAGRKDAAEANGAVGRSGGGPNGVGRGGAGPPEPLLRGLDGVNGAARVNGAAGVSSAAEGDSAGMRGEPADGGAAAGRGGNGAADGGPAAGRGGNGAAAERSGGSGLGLSIVQAIATAHGGRATLESWPGQGTKVRVWLPVRIVP
ncbi:MAG: ATP-binding protein [Streptosporangiaceae bacterium]